MFNDIGNEMSDCVGYYDEFFSGDIEILVGCFFIDIILFGVVFIVIGDDWGMY